MKVSTISHPPSSRSLLARFSLSFLVCLFLPMDVSAQHEAPEYKNLTTYDFPTLPTRRDKATLTVEHYQQCGQSYSGDMLGTCNETICQSGCALASASMVLSAHLKMSFTSLATVNNWLKANGGYSGGCLLNWSVLENYPGCNGLQWYASTGFSIATVKAEIDAGNPVILNTLNNGINHFVVIKGYNGTGANLSDYVVLDPAKANPQTLNSYSLLGLRIYHNVNGTNDYALSASDVLIKKGDGSLVTENTLIKDGTTAYDFQVTVNNTSNTNFNGKLFLSWHKDDANLTYITDLDSKLDGLPAGQTHTLKKGLGSIISEAGNYVIIAKYNPANTNSYITLTKRHVTVVYNEQPVAHLRKGSVYFDLSKHAWQFKNYSKKSNNVPPTLEAFKKAFPSFSFNYPLEATAFYNTLKILWKGSCFGMAVSSLASFHNMQDFNSNFLKLGYNVNNVSELENSQTVENGINALWFKQFSVGSMLINLLELDSWYNPKTALDDIQDMLNSYDGSNPEELKGLYMLNPYYEGSDEYIDLQHLVVPYKITKVSDKEFYVYIYDNGFSQAEHGIKKIIIKERNGKWYWTYDERLRYTNGEPVWCYTGLGLSNPVHGYIYSNTPPVSDNCLLSYSLSTSTMTNNLGQQNISYGQGTNYTLSKKCVETIPFVNFEGSLSNKLEYIFSPTHAYHLEAKDYAEDTTSFFFQSGAMFYKYQGLKRTHADIFDFSKNKVSVVNQADSKTFSMQYMEATQGALLDYNFSAITLSGVDTLKFDRTNPNLVLYNLGGEKTINFKGTITATGFSKEVTYNGLVLNAHSYNEFEAQYNGQELLKLVMKVDLDFNGSFDKQVILYLAPSNLPVYLVPSQFPTIQAGINHAFANGGGIVRVASGEYFENITITNGVYVESVGQNPCNTIINGGNKQNTVEFKDCLNGGIIGFTIKKSGANGQFAGIKISGGNQNPIIANNIITQCNNGMFITGNAKPMIFNNTIAYNSGEGLFTAGNSPATIANNIIAMNGSWEIRRNGGHPFAMLEKNCVFDNNANLYQNITKGLGDINVNPLFVSNTNLQLSNGSPCINATTGLDGKTINIGANCGYSFDWVSAYRTEAITSSSQSIEGLGAKITFPTAKQRSISINKSSYIFNASVLEKNEVMAMYEVQASENATLSLPSLDAETKIYKLNQTSRNWELKTSSNSLTGDLNGIFAVVGKRNIVSPIEEPKEFEVKVFPNPIEKGKTLKIALKEEAKSQIEVKILTANSKILASYTLPKGKDFEVTIPENAPKGMLLLQITTAGFSETKLIVVQ